MSDNYSNPFEDQGDVNPFAQPISAPAASPAVAPASVTYKDTSAFNPFAQPSSGFAATQAPTASLSAAPPKASMSSPAIDAVSPREQELQRRLAELEAREAQLRASGVLEKPKNWPVCYPLVRHAIDEDILDPTTRRLVKFTYYAYILHIVCLTLNMVGALAILVSPAEGGAVDSSAGTNFGISVVFFALGIPLSWVFWYRPLYNAADQDKASMYLIFLCMFAANIVFIGVIIIGISAGGSVGFITMIQTFSLKKIPAGVICIIGMVAWGCELGLDIFIIIRVYMHFRGRGGTDQVKKEAAGGVATFAAENPGLAVSAMSAASSARV